MDNVRLLEILNASHLREYDREQVMRIFRILPDNRKIYVLDHWAKFEEGIQRSREQLEEEKRILTNQAFERIEKRLYPIASS
jgi:hypothetical protein